MRQIILDTETTGFNPLTGDKIIEIGAVELIKRRLTGNNYHQYIQPEREVPPDAIAVHGITDAFLKDKPIFKDVVEDFMNYVAGAELIIHNAPFDVGFINAELAQLPKNPWGKIEDHCTITDSLKMARKAFPGQRASLDALCKRLGIDNSNRTLHGALLDSEILADVYLMMTGGQTDLMLASAFENASDKQTRNVSLQKNRHSLKVIRATAEELEMHHNKLAEISKKFGATLNW
ncbi:DNA polymerase III subunit epsilon [Thiosulfativibrio zosterae]|uniref:DNA polymerase III subunit epsilon n=1 Tax=Thiosulfativibrio zosterae TaxID=2675053 RepID=A0A6F8PPB6_9GAMM|nr:DNA polymerase III subunit epsilon [Thiosulfativibrio zosterae]BBP43916.1 DNA polymerase III subunit epsilon [Thiosulfativibrio zosterae]